MKIELIKIEESNLELKDKVEILKKIKEYQSLACKCCLNTDCKNNINYLKRDKVTIIKCNDFISPSPNLLYNTRKNISKIKKEIQKDEQDFYTHLLLM